MKANEFEKKFDENNNITEHFDLSELRRPKQELNNTFSICGKYLYSIKDSSCLLCLKIFQTHCHQFQNYVSLYRGKYHL